MENRPFPIPTGEAFLVKTPYLDKIADRLYAEQKQRELTQQNEAKLLDTEFSKNVSKLRDADIPEYTKKYQDYKNAKINLLKGKFKTNDDFIKAQLDAQRAMADWVSLGAKSIQEKETEEQYAKAVMNDKTGRYDANAPKVLIERRKTPLSKFKQEVAIPGTNTVVPIDLNDIDGLVKYKGQNTDFTKTFKDAQGVRQVYGGEVTTPSKDGLTTTKTVYKAFNPPSKQFEVLINSRKGANWEKDFLINHDYTDAEANEIVAGYERLKQTPEFQAAYKDIPDIPQTAFASNLGRAMALSVMKNAQLNPPIAETKKSQQDIGAVMDRKWDEWFKKNKITDQQKRERIRLNKEGGGGFYEIDNIPLKLQQNTKSVTYINPDTKQLVTEDLVDVTDLSTAQKDDIFGKKDQYGMYVNQPFVNQGRQFLKITPDGYQGKGTFKVTPKEIIIATHKRTVGEEKPAGTGKMKVRGTAPAGNTGTKKQGEADDL